LVGLIVVLLAVESLMLLVGWLVGWLVGVACCTNNN